MNVISYGGGVQSTTLLVLAARQKIEAKFAIFVDLLDAENPATRRYVERIAQPYACAAGIEMLRVPFDALGEMMLNPAHPRPPFRAESGAPAARQCTIHWKLRPFRRALRALMRREGVKVGSNSVNVFLGISYDEVARMRPSGVRYYRNEYPLVDLRLTRQDCVDILQEEGLIVPDKSSCWFCPFSSGLRQQSLLLRYPHLNSLANRLQSEISKARAERGLPALQVIRVSPFSSEDSECTGHCFT